MRLAEKIIVMNRKKKENLIKQFENFLDDMLDSADISYFADLRTKYFLKLLFDENDGYWVDFKVTYKDEVYYHQRIDLGFCTSVFADDIMESLIEKMEEEGFQNVGTDKMPTFEIPMHYR